MRLPAIPALAFALLGLATCACAQLAPVFQKLELIEEIDVSRPVTDTDRFLDYPSGGSRVATVLGKPVRVLPNDTPGVKFFGYRIGKGKGLQAGESYVLELVYPEDAPRSMIVVNYGCETTRGFHTGRTVGDALDAAYASHNPESLEVPLSKRFETWQTLFSLHDRYPGQKRPRDTGNLRDQTPADGFWVYVAQFAPEQEPLSQGAAVATIRLYKAPAFQSYAQPLRLPPAGLPQRHLFFREEMADGVIDPREPEKRGVTESDGWYEQKARLMRFLGMNTFSKDLLEFGANQGWDSAKFGGNQWVFQNRDPQLWERLVTIAGKYDLNVLPYYEYAGSKGRQGLGPQKRAMPLTRADYTHIKWGENARADLTDPDTFEDFRKMLEITIVDQKDKARFVGAWLRPRASQLPISFADATLARYTADRSKAAPVTRERLQSDKALYADYLSWWNDKRRDFLYQVREYLRGAIGDRAVVLYTADHTEAGMYPQNWNLPGVVVEDAAPWKALGKKTVTLAEAISGRRHFHTATRPIDTWGGWEWQHAAPPHDPLNYTQVTGVLPTFTFNRAYTVGDAAALEAFETRTGLALIRHYGLNEHMFRDATDPKGGGPLGYFVTDMERTGPFVMLAEARAMANGNPTMIGYLAGNSFNRGFPQYVRAFNAAFLALPALPSVRLPDASPDPEVVVRRIDAGAHGTYYAIVNTGYASKRGLQLKLPAKGRVLDAATGQPVKAAGGQVPVDLFPCQLLSLHVAND